MDAPREHPSAGHSSVDKDTSAYTSRRNFITRLGAGLGALAGRAVLDQPVVRAAESVSDTLIAGKKELTPGEEETVRLMGILENKYDIKFPLTNREIEEINSGPDRMSYMELPPPQIPNINRVKALEKVLEVLPPRFYARDEHGQVNFLFNTMEGIRAMTAAANLCKGILDKRETGRYAVLASDAFNPAEANGRRKYVFTVAHELGHGIDPNLEPGNKRKPNREVDQIFAGSHYGKDFPTAIEGVYSQMEEMFEKLSQAYWDFKYPDGDFQVISEIHDGLVYALKKPGGGFRDTPEEFVAKWIEFRFGGSDISRHKTAKLLPAEIAQGMHSFIDHTYFRGFEHPDYRQVLK